MTKHEILSPEFHEAIAVKRARVRIDGVTAEEVAAMSTKEAGMFVLTKLVAGLTVHAETAEAVEPSLVSMRVKAAK